MKTLNTFPFKVDDTIQYNPELVKVYAAIPGDPDIIRQMYCDQFLVAGIKRFSLLNRTGLYLIYNSLRDGDILLHRFTDYEGKHYKYSLPYCWRDKLDFDGLTFIKV